MKQPVPVQSPIKGVNRVVNREGQPPDTCWDALNVLPFDRFGRRRVAQRSGLTKQYATNLGATRVQGLLPVNKIIYPATLNSTGLTFYNEAFTSLATFGQSWSNVPSTATVSSNKLTVPAGFAPPVSAAGMTGYTPNLPSTATVWKFTVSVAFTRGSPDPSIGTLFTLGINYAGTGNTLNCDAYAHVNYGTVDGGVTFNWFTTTKNGSNTILASDGAVGTIVMTVTKSGSVFTVTATMGGVNMGAASYTTVTPRTTPPVPFMNINTSNGGSVAVS